MRFPARTALSALGIAVFASQAAANPPTVIGATPQGVIVLPDSSVARPEDVGLRAHTTGRLLIPAGPHTADSGPVAGFETPASLACVHGLVPKSAGCNPLIVTAVPSGGSRVLAIVDAYDYPTATNDLTVFSQQFGLAPIDGSDFAVVYAAGRKPAQDPTGGWEISEAFDIELAHAFAPAAKVILVEAASNSNEDLFKAVDVATKLVEAGGGGEVVMSWGEFEFAGQAKFDKHFGGSHVVYVSAVDGNYFPVYPATARNVLAVGDTYIVRNGKGDYMYQQIFGEEGGGPSRFTPVPRFQREVKRVHRMVGDHRSSPDMAFAAGRYISFYDSTPYNGNVQGWNGLAGTPAAPTAGIINAAGSFAASTTAELDMIYDNYRNRANWTDIVVGACEDDSVIYYGFKGFDQCSGVGAPYGYGGK